MSGAPSVAELLPHAGPMRLLHRVLEHGPEGAACEARAADAAIFRDAAGRIPAWVAIEWMAQCAGVHGALAILSPDAGPSVGYLASVQKLRFGTSSVPADALLRVEARREATSGGLHAFACRAETADGALVAEGRLAVFAPRDAR